jgi:hypothetical protein
MLFASVIYFLLVQLNGKNAVTKNGSGWGWGEGREKKVIMERFKQKRNVHIYSRKVNRGQAALAEMEEHVCVCCLCMSIGVWSDIEEKRILVH